MYAQVILSRLLLQPGLNFSLFLRYQLLLVKNIHVRLGRFRLRDPKPPARFPYGKRGGGGMKINAAGFGASPRYRGGGGGRVEGNDATALPQPPQRLRGWVGAHAAAGRLPSPVRCSRPGRGIDRAEVGEEGRGSSAGPAVPGASLGLSILELPSQNAPRPAGRAVPGWCAAKASGRCSPELGGHSASLPAPPAVPRAGQGVEPPR